MHIFDSPAGDVSVPDISLTEFVMQRAKTGGDKLAIIDSVTGQRITYSELVDYVARVAGWLQDHGVGLGDAVAIISPNFAEYVIVFHGALACGARVTTLNPLATPNELLSALELTQVKTVIGFSQVLSEAAPLLLSRGITQLIAIGPEANSIQGATPFVDLLLNKPLETPVAIKPARDIALLPFSSGTSGAPKAVMLTHRNCVAALSQVALIDKTDSDSMILGMLPFFHIYGMIVLMNHVLSIGATVVTVSAPDIETILNVIQKHRVTAAAVVAPIVQAFARHPLVDHFDLSSLRLVQSGATSLDPALGRMAADRLGCPVVSSYGLTETTTIVSTVTRDAPVSKHASAGQLVPGTELRIRSLDDARDLGPGEQGEIWLRGPQIMTGYLGNEAATKRSFSEDGWLQTGDVGEIDEDGFINIRDRLKEFIKYKGYQIAPTEIEAVLMRHPAIVDAAVVGSPDAEAGEVPKGFVVAQGEVTAQEIVDYVADQVAPYKKLRDVVFVNLIPKTPAGKVLRRVLTEGERDAFADARAAHRRLRDRVIMEEHDSVLLVTLDRPRKANAFDPDMFLAVAEAFTEYEDRTDLRCAVLAANGLVFSSGMDLLSSGPLAARGELTLPEGYVDFYGFQGGRSRTKPVIAAVHGKCLNLGVELMLACDIAIAADTTVFAQQEVSRGIYPFGGATIKLPLRIGVANALRYILTADEWSAQQAKEMGLIQVIAPDGEHIESALEMAAKIARNAPLGVTAALRNTNTLLTKGVEAAYAELPADIQKLTSSDDFREGVRAFVEKRDPVFSGS